MDHKIKQLEDLLQQKINWLLKNDDDIHQKKLPGLVEALKDLKDIYYK